MSKFLSEKKKMLPGKFIMIEGLDGSGKGVAADSLKEYFKDKKIIDLREYWKENEGFPDISEYDIIISAEPTFTGIGKHIREKLIKNGTTHSSKEIAEAYSNDRLELYKKIIIPALEQGKIIIQERGVITSLAYQPMMGESYTLEEIKQLEGNKFCLEHSPNLLVITTVKPEVVIERLNSREKRDDAIFEKIEFQKKVEKIYESDWLKKIFEDKGSKVVYLDTNPPKTVEDTKKKIIELFKEI
jgi:dTMP kinase